MSAATAGSVLAYNPDLVAKEDLIRGFTARQRLLERFIEDIRLETGSDSAQHHLVIGQRGTGKTTLLRRLAYAVEDSDQLFTGWQPVVFPEEQYNITDLTSFWLNCVDALGDMLDRQGNVAAVEALDGAVEGMPVDPVRRREAALQLLTETSVKIGKRLLLLVDNIDIVLDRIGEEQEWEFRRALHEQSRLLLVGASSRALEQAYEHGRAFYDFFRVHELSGLSEEETLAVLRSLAEQHGADRLCRLLEENPGRIRAMRVLTGGNPRTIVLLFKVLLQNTEGDLETDLQQLLDQYTPLYKARLEDLPQQAQVLVDAIAVNWDPIIAGDLAAVVRLPVNAVSAQLQRLEVLGVVEKTPWYGEKKNAFQIAERFFNIWYLMRGSRRLRRRLIWLVKFLELWFNEEELRVRAQAHLSIQPDTDGDLSYADRSFAYAEAIGDGPLRTALEHAGLRAYLGDEQTGKLIDLGDLPTELCLKKERMELLQALRSQVLALDLRAIHVEPGNLWALLAGSPHYSLAEKQRIATELSTLAPSSVRELFRSLARAKQRLLNTYRTHAAVVEKLYQELAYGDMDDVYDWPAARACAELPGCQLLPYIGINARLSEHLAATPASASELGRAESVLRFMAADSLCAASGNLGLGNLLSYRLERFEEAAIAYRKAAELAPTFSWPWNNLGNLYRDRLKRYGEAEAAYRRAIELEPQRARIWDNLGWLLTFNLARHRESEAAFRKAIELDPDYAYAWNNLGVLLNRHLKRYAEAEVAYRKATELEPEYAFPWNNLGNLLKDHQKRYDEAETAYRKAIELDPIYATPWNNLGNLLNYQLGRYEEAEAAYRKAIELDPKRAYPWNGLGNLLLNRRKHLDEAEVAIRRAIELEPKYAAPWNNLGNLLKDRPELLNEALAAYRKAIELDPEFPYPWNNLGNLLKDRQKRYEEAEAAYCKAIELDPGYAGAYSNLGNLLRDHQKRYDEAETAYGKAIALEPRNPRHRRSLGQLLEFEMNRPAEAGASYLEALRVDPSTVTDRVRLRSVCHRLADTPGQIDEAEQLARQGLSLCAGDPGFQAALAHALVARGAWEEARPLVESWAKAAPPDQGGIALFRAIVAAGRHKEALYVLEKAEARERLRPLYVALQAVEAGNPNYLRRVSPEVRGPATTILSRITRWLTGQV